MNLKINCVEMNIRATGYGKHEVDLIGVDDNFIETFIEKDNRVLFSYVNDLDYIVDFIKEWYDPLEAINLLSKNEDDNNE